jgi:hypothetical protein
MDDDAAALGKGYDTIEDTLTASKEHKKWEDLFCGAMHENGHLKSAQKCSIQLSDCTSANDEMMKDEPRADIYIVSDMRATAKGDEIVFAVQNLDEALFDQSLE